MITITRQAYTNMGTFGHIVIDGQDFFTVERPWIDNTPFKSCIPEGEYRVVLDNTTVPVPKNFGDKAWYVIGGTVGLNIGERTRIAFHVANTMDDVQGCIGVGLRLSTVRGKWAVADSTRAMEVLRTLLPDEWDLRIKWGMGTG